MSAPLGSTKSEAPLGAKIAFVTVVFIMATVAVVWLSGAIFFALHKIWPLGKTGFGTWWTYWQAYGSNPAEGKKLKLALLMSVVPCYGVVVAVIATAFRQTRSLHGDARFAHAGELQKSGLLGEKGIVVGKHKDRFLLFSGMQFLLLCAPTRSGKGVSIVIPNLLAWPESVVVLDIKLENFLITSKFRAHVGHEVYLFNPFSISEDGEGNPLHGRTHRYNPLGYVSDDPDLRVTDILAIGYSLYPGDGRDAFFDDAARNLFLGIVLYLCETPALPRTFGELLRQSSGKGKPVKEYLTGIIRERNFREYADVVINELDEDADEEAAIQAVVKACGLDEALVRENLSETQLPWVAVENVKAAEAETMADALRKAKVGLAVALDKKLVPLIEWDGVGDPMLSSVCVDALNRFINTSDNTLSSILATFNVPLTMWASPVVDAATSTNDFDLRDVRKKRMAIYFGIPANKLAEAKLLINVFYTQLLSLNTNRLLHSTPDLKYTCLMLNDEFTAPGRIGIIDRANAYQAGYGMRLVTIVQSPGQLEADPPKGYGKDGARTLMTNHACQIVFPPREQRDANEYSEMLGYYTFRAKGSSRQLDGRSGRSESESDQRRALMLPQELKELDQAKEIILLENSKPILADKVTYYAEPKLMDRLKSVSPELAQLGKALPGREQFERLWGRGDLASPVPVLDLDLHKAVIEQRMREVTAADAAKGIDLSKLTADLSNLKLTADQYGVAPEEIQNFVDGFFGALDAAAPDEDGEDVDADGSLESVSDDELAALDAEMAAEDAQDATEGAETVTQAWVAVIKPAAATAAGEASAPASEAVEADQSEDAQTATTGEAEELSDEELSAMMDDVSFSDDFDGMPEPDFPPEDEFDDGAEESPTKTESIMKRKPLLDLSVLERPAKRS